MYIGFVKDNFVCLSIQKILRCFLTTVSYGLLFYTKVDIYSTFLPSFFFIDTVEVFLSVVNHEIYFSYLRSNRGNPVLLYMYRSV